MAHLFASMPRKITATVRRRFRRKRYCAYCGRFLQRNNRTIDHKEPFAQSRNHNLGNLEVCCKLCNHYKDDKGYQYWLSFIEVCKAEYNPDPLIKGFKIGPTGSFIQK